MMNKSLLFATAVILASCASPVHAVSPEEEARVDKIGQESLRRGIGYGICNPDLELNMVVVSYTNGHNETHFKNDSNNPVHIIGRTIYMQDYGSENVEDQRTVMDHELAHYCMTEETYSPPIQIDDDLEVLGTDGFAFIIRNRSTNKITDIRELEEGRATSYSLNIANDREDVERRLIKSSKGYVEVSQFLDILSKSKNISSVTMDFSKWYKAVTGKEIHQGDLGRFIKIFMMVDSLEMSPEDAAKSILESN